MSIARFALVALLLFATGLPVAPPPASAAHTSAATRRAKRAHKRLVRAVRRKGLASLPPVSGALASQGGTQGSDVVGVPPTLAAIAAGDPTALFWGPGVVAAIAGGSATPEQCSEFWSGKTDGSSAGLGACRVAGILGEALGRIIQSENSVGYMRGFPTPANVHAGGVAVGSGTVPGHDITRLFSVPPSEDRVVEVQVSGEDKDQRVMLRVANADANAAAGNLYHVDIWFCPLMPGGQVRGVDHLALASTGELTVLENEGNDDGSVSVNTVVGWVIGSGPGATWDTTKARTADVAWGGPNGTFKSAVEIDGDEIHTRAWSVFGGEWKSYTATRFSGTGSGDIRFLSGAFEESGNSQTNTGTAEYREPQYVAAPGLDLATEVGTVDLATDPFFASAPTMPSVDATGYSCDTTGDVVVTLDFANPIIAAVKAACEGQRLDGIEFCENNQSVNAAEQNFASTCVGP